MLRILIEDSEGKSKLAPINPEAGDITIGRKEGNIIRLKERNVSRNHARIYNAPDGLFIEPVAARYGLKLNGNKIEGPTPLALGDEIRVGDFRLYIQDESTAETPKQESPDAITDIEPALQPRFVVISSNYAGVEYHVQKSRVSIGRNPDCDISIHHQSVSGYHAEIKRTPRGDYEIRDTNSSNGTKVNGIEISGPFKLNSGDAVTLGHVTMRYCGPGDFWSLNFGINDEPKRTNPIFIVAAILGGVVLIVLLVIVVVKLTLANAVPQTVQPIVQGVDENAAKKADFDKALVECESNMMKGMLQNAEEACKKAQKIFPDDEKYENLHAQLLIEKSSKNALEEARNALDEESCRNALEALNTIEQSTWAARQMNDGDLKNKAKDCLEKTFLSRAMASIEDGNIADAEIARDEIQKIRRESPNIAAINDAIKAKTAKSSGSSSRPKPAANSETAPAPKPSSAVDLDALCIEGTKLKMKKDYCKAYEVYRKVKKAGWPNDTCKKAGENVIAAYAAQCNK